MNTELTVAVTIIGLIAISALWLTWKAVNAAREEFNQTYVEMIGGCLVCLLVTGLLFGPLGIFVLWSCFMLRQAYVGLFGYPQD
jgi:putative Mn2+ efflux pump MntP